MNLLSAQASGDRFAESVAIFDVMRAERRFSGRSPLPMRFFEKVAYGASDCWYWIGSRCQLGYGQFNAMAEHKAHRVSWRLFRGDPQGLKVLHRCDVRSCVNPEHLFLGTQVENIADMVAKGRQRGGGLCGENNPRSRLTWEKVREIRRRVAAGAVQRHLCDEFGVSPMTISRIVNHQLWREQ